MLMQNLKTAIALPRPIAALGHFAITRSRPVKRKSVMIIDAGLCAACSFLSVFLRLGFIPERDTPFGLMIAISIAIALPIFHMSGLYREIFSQAGIRALVRVARACALYTLPFAMVFTLVSVSGIPRTVTLIQPILLFVSVAGSRVAARYWLFGTESLRRLPRRRVIIYGAGSAGRQLAGAISQSSEMAVVGFFDDDPTLIGSVMDGCRIYAPEDMGMAAERLTAAEVLLAMPSAARARRTAIIAAARDAGVRLRTLPGLVDIAHGRVDPTQLRELEIEDLLGRDCVTPDTGLMTQATAGKIIMVTGAGGSIGSEICRQLLALKPATLLLVEISEFGLYEVHRELVAKVGEGPDAARIIPLLSSVLDEDRMDDIVETWRPDTIYHAAAYKHVPLVEHNPAEGVRTNIIGTYTMARIAARRRTPAFVLVSTDKAVRPTNVMGATKRAAEQVLQALDTVSSATRFSMVRFGNVLGSSGSVVPLFRQQIRAGGPVTITDRRMTRYFMTMPEAAELVLQARAMAEGGEVFVLDMGTPVQIIELARNMVELAGYRVRDEHDRTGDIDIIEIGLRPGEKLFEELLIGNSPSPTLHPRIMKADEAFMPLDRLRECLERLRAQLDPHQCAELIATLQELVPEFDHRGGIVDWLHLNRRRSPVLVPVQQAV
jgi:FlaA1/EpsC-like NDP-sugar epimerase